MSPPSSLQLAYRPDLDMLTARWFTESDLPQLQEEYAAVLAAGLAAGTTRWLLDVRRRDVPTAEAAHWVSFEWLPRAAAQVGGPLRLAFLISPLRAEALRTAANLQPSVRAVLDSPQPYQLQTFGDEGAAVTWLVA